MDLNKAQKLIRRAWIFGIIFSTLVTTCYVLAVEGVEGYDIEVGIEAFVMFGMCFGIYKRSRTCAIILFIYCLWKSIFYLGGDKGVVEWWVGVMLIGFLWAFFDGIRATFAYNKLIKNGKVTGEDTLPMDVKRE